MVVLLFWVLELWTEVLLLLCLLAPEAEPALCVPVPVFWAMEHSEASTKPAMTVMSARRNILTTSGEPL